MKKIDLRAARETLKLYFGYDSFRPMQEDIVEAVLNGQDTLVLMPTGGGKSVCFQVPALVMPGIAVVVSPLIALMKDQVESLIANGIQAAFLNSTQSSSEQFQIETDSMNGNLKLLYVSPEKLLSAGFFNFLSRLKLNLFAIDEAHCISAWGHDFRPEYTQLNALKQQFPEVPVIALTATADRLTQKDIAEQLSLRSPKIFISSFDRPNLSLQVVPGQNRINRIMDFLDNHRQQPGIIYCLSRQTTENLANKLKTNGYKAACYHAGLSNQLRSSTQEKFLNDDIQIVCATVAFGMGIDKSNVRWVIHYNLPKNLEGYYQEIGRAGRDGAKADTLLFYSYADVMSLRNMLQEGDPKQVELQVAKLERMQQYAEATMCRRKILLNYFGETLVQDCKNCDICRNPPVSFNGTTIAQKALSAIARSGEQVSSTLLIDVLRGARNQAVIEKGLDRIKTYGAGREYSSLDWNSYIQQLINAGLIDIAYDRKYALQLNERSKKVLFENQPVQLVKFELTKPAAEPVIKSKPKKELLKDELFERLRALRKKIADELQVPPYVIFTDATLIEMAAEKPANRISMLAISGVGAMKYEKYGYDFITEIMNFVTEQQAQGNKIKGATHLVTYELYQKGIPVDEIARQRNLNPVTIFSHLATLYEQGYTINLHQFITPAEYQQIVPALTKLGPDAKLKELFEFLQERIDYAKIRFAVSIFKKQQNTLKNMA